MPRRAGVRAVQCTPLFSGSGKPVGIFSTHYRKPHRPLECVLQLLDLLTRRGADVIERAQMEASLYESEERFRALVTASSDVVYRTSADWTEMHYLRGNYDGTRGGAASLRIPPNRYDTSLGSQHRCKGKNLEEWCFPRPPLLRTPCETKPLTVMPFLLRRLKSGCGRSL
jgi:hypothetical protein